MTTIILDATTKSIEAVMSGAAATTNPDFVATYADSTPTAFTEGSNDGALNGTTPVTLVSAPSASTQRVVKSISIQNRDTAPVTITISYNNNTTLRQMAVVTLAVGDTWTLDGTFANDGALKNTNVSSFTASSTDTLTNKTFDANGTGNSLSNVDVADLANGTDGELITWDATGAPATVATGTADQILTSNGAGAAPTFQALDISKDTTPQLGGELDAGAHSIGFTMQTATGDGTTTIDWGNGNHFDFTFGAQNETFTFTAPAKPGVYTLSLKQDSVGSRTATWPATVKWAGGTAPTLTTTATTGYDIISFRYDGTNYYGIATLNFS